MEDISGRQNHIFAQAIRRHVVLVLVITIAFTGLAAAFTLTRPEKYTSTAKVLVNPLAGNALSSESLASSQLITVALTTEAALVTSPEVSDRAAELRSPETIPPPSAVHAVVPPNTRIIQIRVTSRSSVDAANAAQAYAEAFLSYRLTKATAVSRGQLASLQGQAAEAETKLKAAALAARSDTPPPDAQSQVQLWQSVLATLRGKIGDLEAAVPNPGSVISRSVPPNKPDGLNPFLVIAVTVLLGLGAGVVVAIWRERRDDRIRTAYDDSVAGIPVLATLPGRRRMSPQRMAEMDADDELRTCYRRARAGVIAGSGAPAVLVVSSVDQGSDVESAGEVAANLGWSLTSAGFAVTLVDATIGQGHVAELLGVETIPGLSENLVTSSATGPLTRKALGMNVVPAGRDPEASREFYAGARLLTSLSWFTSESDYVIVAGPPLGTPDGEAVALVGDALLLVVVDRVTTHGSVATVLDRVRQLNVRVIGAVGLQARVLERARSKGSNGSSGSKPSRRAKQSRAGEQSETAAELRSANGHEAPMNPVVAARPADPTRGDDGR